MHLLEIHPGQIIVQARLCELPAGGSQRERAVEKAAQVALARLRSSASVLTTDEDETSLWLQRRVPAEDLLTLDRAVEGLANDIDLWRLAL